MKRNSQFLGVYAGAMESEPIIAQSLLPMEPFVAATAEVNEWRGRCLDTFSRAEIAVTGCLLALSQVKERGVKIRLPHLVGQRIDALSRALEPGGPFEAEAGKATATLLEYAEQIRVRNILCHAQSRITLDQRGRWTFVLRMATLRSRAIARDVMALSEYEAQAMRQDLGKLGQRLCSQLTKMRERLAP